MNKDKIKRFEELITRQVETGVADVDDILSVEANTTPNPETNERKK